jgi:hypothetical protein
MDVRVNEGMTRSGSKYSGEHLPRSATSFIRGTRGSLGMGRDFQVVWFLAVDLRDSQPLQSKGLELQSMGWNPARSPLD